MDLGLIDGCEAYGSVESQSGDYVGGVAGICSAAIENCWAKCALSGGRYVGGITGTGVTDSVTGSGSTVSGNFSDYTVTGIDQAGQDTPFGSTIIVRVQSPTPVTPEEPDNPGAGGSGARFSRLRAGGCTSASCCARSCR